jgi:hypothetical protein
MKRFIKLLTVGLTVCVMATASLAPAAQTKKASSSSNQSVFQKMSSATSNFFKNVTNTLTGKKTKSSKK